MNMHADVNLKIEKVVTDINQRMIDFGDKITKEITDDLEHLAQLQHSEKYRDRDMVICREVLMRHEAMMVHIRQLLV